MKKMNNINSRGVSALIPCHSRASVTRNEAAALSRRYLLNVLDPRLRGDDVRSTPMAELIRVNENPVITPITES
jgi:hypothetical protein